MKTTIIRTDSKQQLHVTIKTIEDLLARIAHDDAKGSVARYRDLVAFPDQHTKRKTDLGKWAQIYPTSVFGKDRNENLVWKGATGILLLTFHSLSQASNVEEKKRAAAMLPSTLCAIMGADGKSVHILVRYADSRHQLPQTEEDAQQLYAMAFRHASDIYQAMLGCPPSATTGTLHDHFALTLDSHPYFNHQAVALSVDRNLRQKENYSPTIELQTVAESGSEKTDSTKDNMMRMIQFLNSRYRFRFNTIMKYTEYKSLEKDYGWLPIEPRVQKRMTIEVQLADIRVSIKDVRNYLESDLIPNYWPVDDYLNQCRGKWDGKDHIRALARTVPTSNKHWADWFYTWYLGMVDQWRSEGRLRSYGNSVVPLLISTQGYNKSTFCRQLIPKELQWGYNDNMILSEKRQVLQAMSQFLLVNLDEFNQISPSVQQGFLKNIIQLPSVKIKRPYGSHVEEFPRLASFIATSNMDDVLADPSGNRRFIGIELTGPIDLSVAPNHTQLYAQALEALERGEQGWFDAKQTSLIIENNRRFQVVPPIEQCFRDCFTPTTDEGTGQYMTVATLYQEIKRTYGSSIKTNSLISFGRILKNIHGLRRKRSKKGTEYLVTRNTKA